MPRPIHVAGAVAAWSLVTLAACGGGDPVTPNASKGDDANANADASGVTGGTADVADVEAGDGAGVDAETHGDATNTVDSSADAGPVPCKSDKDCLAIDLVCNKAKALCVACNADVDCAAEFSCTANVCVPPPTSCG